MLGSLCASAGFAGSLLLPHDPDARWTLVSPPLTGAPLEQEDTELLNSSIEVISSKKRAVLLHSPANAHLCRMAAEHMHRRLAYPDGTLYYPKPTQLPLYVENTTLEL